MITFEFNHPSFEYVLLVVSVLLVCSVLSSKISSKVGVPTLLLFLGIGMLAGSEGWGGIEFNNYSLSYAVGSVCLAIILFDGGMGTHWKSVKTILPTGVSLSVFGTILTAVTTGIFAHFAFDLKWGEAFLLGSIISSTDAAAVFSILKAKSLTVNSDLKKTLELEAGSNDPIAVFMTISALTYVTTPETGILIFIKLFFMQAIIGFALGIGGGKAIQWLINNVNIDYEGLYGVLLLGVVLFLFAITATLGGSGFLAVYVAGLVLGNLRLLHKETIIKFQDGIAWMAQIAVFLTLGLLVFPSHLVGIWKEGILLVLFMMFVARPVSVMIAAWRSKMNWRERTFVSWIGLRGAAPIILATLPLSVGIDSAEVYFNLIFFVVLITVLLQGMSIPLVAEWLKVTEPLAEGSPRELSEDLLPSGFHTFEINVTDEAPGLDHRVVDLALPSGVLFTSLKREGRYLVPKGDTVIMKGDRIRALARPSNKEELENIFGNARLIV